MIFDNLDSHDTIDVKQEMDSNMMNTIYVAFRMRTHTEIFMQCFTYKWRPKAKSFMLKMQSFNNFYVDEAPMALNIFRFVVFFTVTPLRRA